MPGTCRTKSKAGDACTSPARYRHSVRPAMPALRQPAVFGFDITCREAQRTRQVMRHVRRQTQINRTTGQMRIVKPIQTQTYLAMRIKPCLHRANVIFIDRPEMPGDMANSQQSRIGHSFSIVRDNMIRVKCGHVHSPSSASKSSPSYSSYAASKARFHSSCGKWS